MSGRITIVYQQNEGGWITSSIPEFPGAVSQGKTREEARLMVLDALNELMIAGRENALNGQATSSEVLDFHISSAISA